MGREEEERLGNKERRGGEETRRSTARDKVERRGNKERKGGEETRRLNWKKRKREERRREEERNKAGKDIKKGAAER